MGAMRRSALKRTAVLVATTLATGSLALSGSRAAAAPVTIDLCAVEGSLALPGGVTVPTWGFGVPATVGDCTTATAGLPGPVLTVNQDDTVTVNVTNALPAGHVLSFEIPGIAFDPGPTDAPVGATVTRTFTAGAPGTYLYQSAGDAGRQAAMGLYGALLVRSTTAGQAYGTPDTAYDVEATLVLSAVDPSFNAAPDSFDMTDYQATYWLINGAAYPETSPIVAPAGARVLLRYVNAGFDNTSMALLGMHERVVARDAQLLNNPFDAVSETVPAGATEDAIATMPTSAPPSPNGFALYNRQLHLVNGTAGSPSYNPGGMLAFLQPA
jgi:FtsP/CotA-like multicopper oxidase with cupredoxin domain